MVARTLFAFDSASLLIDPSSPSGTPGNSIINNSSTPNGTIFEFQAGFSRVAVEIDDTAGGSNRLNDGLPNNHVVLDGGGLIADGTGVEGESIIVLRELDAFGNPTGPEFSVSVLSQNGQTSNIWGMATSHDMSPGTLYVKVSGSNLGTTAYADVTCFCKGTLIQTRSDSLAVEALTKETQVREMGGRFPSIRAVFKTTVTHEDLRRNPRLRPVCISAGALGNGLPLRDLLVSRQHRMLVSSDIAKRMFGRTNVLVPAIRLTALPGVYVDEEIEEVEYFHLLFDRHEVIFAEGAPTESLFTGPEALKSVSDEAREEMLALFPELCDGVHVCEPAEFIPPPKRQKQMIARHAKNGKPVLEVMPDK